MLRFPYLAVALLASILLAGPAAAQTTYYDTEGRVSAPDLFQSDGFRPVWQQELEEQRAKAAAEAARQKAQSSAGAATSGAKSNAAPK
jgi:hypothetical protein